jgi:hypothetical protein
LLLHYLSPFLIAANLDGTVSEVHNWPALFIENNFAKCPERLSAHNALNLSLGVSIASSCRDLSLGKQAIRETSN